MKSNQTSLERLDVLKKNTGYSEFIVNFARRLITEPTEVSEMVRNMEKAIRFDHVDRWADNSNMVGRISQVTRYDITDSSTDTSKKMDIVSGMSSEYSDELGGLKRVFDAGLNDKYLDKMSADSNSESPNEEYARSLVDQAYEQSVQSINFDEAAVIAEEAYNLDDSNFGIAA